MRRILHFICTVVIFSFSAKGATITWDGGGGDGLWSTATNWVGDVVPVPADDVLLDNSVVAGSYSVVLPGGTYSVVLNSFKVSPISGNTITFTVPVTNTANPAFDVTGPGDAVILNSGAIFYNSSGRTMAMGGTAVTVGTTNYFRINNGAKYVHNTSSGHTNNLVSRLSKAAGTEYGIFEFDVRSAGYTISLSGRTYGTLILSSTSFGAPVTYSGSGTIPLLIMGNLQINSGVTLSLGMSADFVVNGNYVQAASSTFSLQNSTSNNTVKIKGNITSQGVVTKTGTGLPVLELSGATNQDINITGSITNSVTLQMNNVAGATLSTSLNLPYKLSLVTGKIKTTSTKILSLLDNATVTGGSSSSFIEGPMIKVGDDPFFTFPIGKGSIYAPISFNSIGLAITDEFTAEYIRVNPQSIYGTSYESPFDHISYVEYWNLQKTTGSLSVPVNVTLSITQYGFAKVLSSTYVARHNSGDNQWKNSGTLSRTAGPTAPPYITGTIESTPLTQLGIFTLATTDPFATNPLPVKLILFNAVKSKTGTVDIDWEIAGDMNEEIKFEIQRSENGKDFVSFYSLQSTGRSVFNAQDSRQLNATNWYRLKLTDKQGVVFFSKTLAVLNSSASHFITGLFPNPVTQDATISINSKVREKINLVIYSTSGKEMKTISGNVVPGNNLISINVNTLNAGVYFIRIAGIKENGFLRFVKL